MPGYEVASVGAYGVKSSAPPGGGGGEEEEGDGGSSGLYPPPSYFGVSNKNNSTPGLGFDDSERGSDWFLRTFGAAGNPAYASRYQHQLDLSTGAATGGGTTGTGTGTGTSSTLTLDVTG